MQDLWADFTGETVQIDGDGRGKGSRQHRLTEQMVLMTLRSWLLQDYMLPYGTSLGAARIFKRCYWIDGLGNTRLPFQEVFVPSTDEQPIAETKHGKSKAAAILPPILRPVAATARQLAQLERPITLQGLALDGKGSRKKPPASSNGHQPDVTPLTLPKEGGLLTQNWPEIAPALLPALEQSAAIFLLNPLKDDLFRYSDLNPLYQRTAPTELFLWLSHKQIETRLLPGLKNPENAAALTNLLRGDRWKSLLTNENTKKHPERIATQLIDCLLQSIKPHFLSVQRLAFPVLAGPILLTNAPYSLLFATRRQDSLLSLNDAVCQRSRHLTAESQQGTLNDEWFAAQREEQTAKRLEQLRQETLSLGQSLRLRRWPELRQHLLLAHFGLHMLSEYDQIITTLLALGQVRCEWRKRSPEPPPEKLLPGNDDILLW